MKRLCLPRTGVPKVTKGLCWGPASAWKRAGHPHNHQSVTNGPHSPVQLHTYFLWSHFFFYCTNNILIIMTTLKEDGKPTIIQSLTTNKAILFIFPFCYTFHNYLTSVWYSAMWMWYRLFYSAIYDGPKFFTIIKRKHWLKNNKIIKCIVYFNNVYEIRQWIFLQGIWKVQNIIKINYCEFPDGLVVRIPSFHCHDLGSILVKELRSQKMGSSAKKKKKKSVAIPTPLLFIKFLSPLSTCPCTPTNSRPFICQALLCI